MSRAVIGDAATNEPWEPGGQLRQCSRQCQGRSRRHTRALPVKSGETLSTALDGVVIDGIRLRLSRSMRRMLVALAMLVTFPVAGTAQPRELDVDLAGELIQLNVDVIVSNSTEAILAV